MEPGLELNNHLNNFALENNTDKVITSKENNSKINKFQKAINKIIKINRIFINKSSRNLDTKFDNFTTFEKIIKLQEDLKIVSSIKQQFEGNRKRMIEKLNLGCQNYFKNKISMKKIFDYCSNDEPEKIYEYNLLPEKQAKEILGECYNAKINR